MRATGSAASRWRGAPSSSIPNHPGWYWYADFYDAYRQGDYRGALGFALKVNLPGHWFTHAAMAAACGQLGERDAAAKALRDLLKLRPDFAATVKDGYREVVGARVRGVPDRRLAQGGARHLSAGREMYR